MSQGQKKKNNISEGGIYTAPSLQSGPGWGVGSNNQVPIPLDSKGFQGSVA